MARVVLHAEVGFTDAVKHEFPEIDVRNFAVVVLIKPLLIPSVIIGRFRRIRADAINLIVFVRYGKIAVHLVRNAHRVINVGIGFIRIVEHVRSAFDQHSIRIRRNVVRV